MKKVLFILFLLAAAGGGYYVWNRQAQAKQDHPLYGNVDIREVNLGFRVSGRIKEVRKDEGDAVKAGDTLALLDDEPYRRDAEEAAAQVASLKAKAEMVSSGYRTEEIEQARATVKADEAILANAERTLIRKKEMAANKVGPQQDYDDAIAARDEALARLNAARAALALQEAGYRKEEIAQAKADLAKAEATLASARIKVADTTLEAPSNGVVITRAMEPGAIVQPGTTVLTVSLSDPVWVRAYIQEDRLGEVHPGKKVAIYTDTHPDKPYSGQVGYVSPEAEFTPKSVQTPELRTSLVYRLRVVVANPGPDLRQGMPVTVRLTGD
jgi:HlyD family secretion protein